MTHRPMPLLGHSDFDVHQYERLVQLLVTEALNQFTQHEKQGRGQQYSRCRGWETVSKTDQIRVTRRNDTPGTSIDQCRLFGRIPGSYDTFFDFFYSDTSVSFQHLQKLLNHHVHEARVVLNIRQRQEERVYFGIKWLEAQARIKLASRAQCFVEYMGFTSDDESNKIGYFAILPLNTPTSWEMTADMRTQRMRSRYVYLFRESSVDNACDFFATGSYELNYSRKNTKAFFRGLSRVLSNLPLYMDLKSFSTQKLTNIKCRVPNAQRVSCALCQRMFGYTRHRLHCRSCRDSICRKCVVTPQIPELQKYEVCKLCFTSWKHEPEMSSVATNGLIDLLRIREDVEIGIRMCPSRQNYPSHRENKEFSRRYSIMVGDAGEVVEAFRCDKVSFISEPEVLVRTGASTQTNTCKSDQKIWVDSGKGCATVFDTDKMARVMQERGIARLPSRCNTFERFRSIEQSLQEQKAILAVMNSVAGRRA